MHQSGRSVASTQPDVAHLERGETVGLQSGSAAHLNYQPLLVSQMNYPNSSSSNDSLQKLRTSSATIKQRLVELQQLRDEVRITEQQAKRTSLHSAARWKHRKVPSSGNGPFELRSSKTCRTQFNPNHRKG
ncbi:cytochrome c-type biogenesis protein CcmH/NrfG [Nitrobacteraceae bacterium AZCC 2161]